MTNLLASGHQSLSIIRRDLEDLFIEFNVPRRMLREVDRVFVQAPSPIWLWREMDQILEEFMAPPMLRNSVERVFDRVLSSRSFGMHTQSFGSPFASSWRNELNTGNMWNPWNTTNSFSGTFNNTPFVNTPFVQTRGSFGYEDFTPPLELVETQSELVVRVDLPGVRETDVETRITEDHVLVIRGERRDFMTRNIGVGQTMSTFGRTSPEYSEQSYGVFTRTVPLPRNINPAHIQAFFRDGVLEVRIPKFETIGAFNTPSAFANNAFNVRNNRRIAIGRDQSRTWSTFGAFGNGNWNNTNWNNTNWNVDHRPHVN